MGRKIHYRPGSIAHVYQRAIHGFVVFYSERDILVCYSLLSVLSAKYRITILGFCPMFNHFHILLEASDQKLISSFMDELVGRSAHEFNDDINRKGQLFTRPYGMSLKRSEKAIRTAVAYLYNNPVEKNQCTRAELARWNFLAYAASDHPFSERLSLNEATHEFKQIIQEIKSVHRQGWPLNYRLLDRWFSKLSEKETEQLTDFIVITYSVIAFDRLVSFYRSFEDMLMAINSNTGSEYDLKEDFDANSDLGYLRMIKFLSEVNGFRHVKDVLRLPEEERREYAAGFYRCGLAPCSQVEKFLHLTR